MVKVSPEVLEGIDAIRESGMTNMFCRNVVIECANMLGFDETAKWVKENQAEYSKGIFEGFETKSDVELETSEVIYGGKLNKKMTKSLEEFDKCPIDKIRISGMFNVGGKKKVYQRFTVPEYLNWCMKSSDWLDIDSMGFGKGTSSIESWDSIDIDPKDLVILSIIRSTYENVSLRIEIPGASLDGNKLRAFLGMIGFLNYMLTDESDLITDDGCPYYSSYTKSY